MEQSAMQRWAKSSNQARTTVDRIVFRWDIERFIAKSIAINEAKPKRRQTELNPTQTEFYVDLSSRSKGRIRENRQLRL
jgi:hypothetical protein